ncbi:hypothetical protein ACLB2K_050731 [Fragaria x ananassa]
MLRVTPTAMTSPLPHHLSPSPSPSQTPFLSFLSLSKTLFLKSFSISAAISQNPESPPNSINGDIGPYSSCSMPHKKPLKVAVLLSGGVDSSVALRLLHAAGHSCTAVYLKIWFQEGFENFWSECPWEEDLNYANAVCNQVDVPLGVVHSTDEYWKNVVSYIIKEYRCGRTPNPDVLCNTRIKFCVFMDAIDSMDFDYVASGHYAKVVHPSADQMDKDSVLELSQDMVKDQTYFVAHLSQDQLKRLIFPLGCLSKDKVANLPQSLICLIREKGLSRNLLSWFSEFIGKHIGEKEGVILEAETGDLLGKHRGFWSMSRSAPPSRTLGHVGMVCDGLNAYGFLCF